MDKPAKSTIFLARGKEVLGPFKPEQVEAMKTSGEFADCTWIWENPAQGWTPINRPPDPPALPAEDDTLPNLSLTGADLADASSKTGFTVTGLTQTGFTQTNFTKTNISQPDFTLTGVTNAEAPPKSSGGPSPEIIFDAASGEGTSPKIELDFSGGETDSEPVIPPPPPSAHLPTPPPGPVGIKPPPIPAAPVPPPKMPGTRPAWIDRGSREDFKHASVRVTFENQGATVQGSLTAASPEGCSMRCKLSKFSSLEFPKGRRLQLTLNDADTNRSETVYAFVDQIAADGEYADLQVSWRKMPAMLS